MKGSKSIMSTKLGYEVLLIVATEDSSASRIQSKVLTSDRTSYLISFELEI